MAESTKKSAPAKHQKIVLTHDVSEQDRERVNVARVAEYLRCVFVAYAQDLRLDNPGFICRNALVLESGLIEFERRGYQGARTDKLSRLCLSLARTNDQRA